MCFLSQHQLGAQQAVLRPQDIPLVPRIMGTEYGRIGHEKGGCELRIPTDLGTGWNRFPRQQKPINAWRRARIARTIHICNLIAYTSFGFAGKFDDSWCHHHAIRIVLEVPRRSRFSVAAGLWLSLSAP